ncbi:hypothetical protein [Haloplanus salilacus]|uniref:hypothetical protein n=1 Tax=Haloplanus salilacus TaxID=2949994 RepID=UPI0030CBA41A
MRDDEGSDLPETMVEASDVLEDESFFTPTEELPDDPAALKAHIEELYVHLARASTVLEYDEDLGERRRVDFEERTAEVRDRAEEASNRIDDVADDLLGSESDGG